MSHDITDTDTIAYAGATPWHKLGTIINANDTFDEAWTKGGLTWTISKRPMLRPNKDGVLVNSNRVSIVRDDNDTELATAGPDWEAYQNTEMRDAFLRPMVETGLVTLETLGSLGGGKKVWALGKIKGGTRDIANVPVNLYTLAAQGHDGTMGLFLGGTAVYVVCNNTLEASLRGGGQVRVRHTRNMRDAVDAVRDAIMSSIENFDKTCSLFGTLASKSYNNEQLTTYLNTVFPRARTQEDVKREAANDFAKLMNKPYVDRRDENQVYGARAEVVASRAHDRILEILQGDAGGQQLPGIKGTAWGAYNAVTNFLTHERGRTADSRMSSLAFGGAAGIGAKALSAATTAFLS